MAYITSNTINLQGFSEFKAKVEATKNKTVKEIDDILKQETQNTYNAINMGSPVDTGFMKQNQYSKRTGKLKYIIASPAVYTGFVEEHYRKKGEGFWYANIERCFGKIANRINSQALNNKEYYEYKKGGEDVWLKMCKN